MSSIPTMCFECHAKTSCDEKHASQLTAMYEGVWTPVFAPIPGLVSLTKCDHCGQERPCVPCAAVERTAPSHSQLSLF